MVVARLCSASTARLQPALAGRSERRWLRTAAAEAGVARWEPMGAREYYDYRRAIYGDITHKAILVDAAGTLIAPTKPVAQFPMKMLPMKTLWLAVYIADAVPFAVFYYEGDQDKFVGKRFRTVLMWVVASAVVCVLILGGNLGFYYKDHEILLPLPVVFHRYIVENFNDASSYNLTKLEVEEFDPPSEVLAVIEGQMLSMRGYAERFGMPNPPKRIIATGGASSNESIVKSIAQIFGCSVCTVQRPVTAKLPHYSC